MAENACLGGMDSNQLSSQDCFLGSFFWVGEDGLCIQESQNLQHQSLEVLPCVDSLESLVASSSSSSSCFGSLPHEIMHSLSSEIHNQNVEMDSFLHLQNNRLRRSILEEEARKRTVTMLEYESRINAIMKQKDEEIATARIRTRELQHFLKAAEMEAAAWERAAKEREATAAELSSRLKLARERGADDAASFCHPPSPGERRNMNCKTCHAGTSSVVFFPCRHICCCKSCEPFLNHCPLCKSPKEARMQVLLP